MATFDGKGHTITVKSFDGPVLDGNAVYLGFFGVVQGGLGEYGPITPEIKNTTIAYDLTDPVVDIRTGDGSTWYDSHAGGVAGLAVSTEFENLRVTGNFFVIGDGNSSLNAGGIVGTAFRETTAITITNCHVTGALGGTSANYLTIGGIAGNIASGSISGSSFTGNAITGSAPSGNCDTGGIAGYMNGGEITACFARGHIKADASDPNVGGIAGTIEYSSIKTSYAAGVIEGIASASYSNSGGIAGRLFDNNSVIENCYAWADVSSSSTYGETAGGIAGTSEGTISKCYAAGTVKSRGTNPYTKIGGIMGESSGAAVINDCMALVTELDGGPTTSSRSVHAICADTYYSTLSGNYSWYGITRIHTDDTDSPSFGSSYRDGEQKTLADFQSPALYGGAGWNFTTGTGDWKFISGYNYPVLSWQDEPPAGGPAEPVELPPV
jgi:hypothetical protein